MPVYELTDPETGKTYKVTANRQPTQEEAEEIFVSQQKVLEQEQQVAEPKDLKLTESALKQDPTWIESSKKYIN